MKPPIELTEVGKTAMRQAAESLIQTFLAAEKCRVVLADATERLETVLSNAGLELRSVLRDFGGMSDDEADSMVRRLEEWNLVRSSKSNGKPG